MARTTVHIPDELLERARAVDGDTNTSRLIQRALEHLIGERTVAGYARPPSDAADLTAKARQRLAPAAEQEYGNGYRAALTTVDGRFWPLLDELCQADFDLIRWANRWRTSRETQHGFSPPDWWEPLAEDIGELVDPISYEHLSFTRTNAFLHGYAAGLRAAYEAVESGPEPGGDEMAAEPSSGGGVSETTQS
jgi:hypothetical protein